MWECFLPRPQHVEQRFSMHNGDDHVYRKAAATVVPRCGLDQPEKKMSRRIVQYADGRRRQHSRAARIETKKPTTSCFFLVEFDFARSGMRNELVILRTGYNYVKYHKVYRVGTVEHKL